MGCASRTRDVSPVPVGRRLAHAEPRRRAGFLEPRLTLRAKACATCATGWAQVAQPELRKPPAPRVAAVGRAGKLAPVFGTSSRISENGGETGSGAPWLSRNHAQPARRYVPGHDQAERTTWFRGQHGRKARPAYVRLEAQSVFLPYQLNIALRRSQPRFRLFGTSRLRLQSEHA